MDSRIIVIAIASVFILTAVNQAQALGVTRPAPYDIQLMKGESAGFVFEIQAVTSAERQACSYSISGLVPLQVTFEENEAIIDAGTIKQVYGTVTAPEGAEIKTYGGTLSVSCGAFSEGQVSGSAVKTTVGGSPFNVKVVDVRDRDIRNVAPPQQVFDYTTIIIIVAVIIIIAIAAGVYYKRKHKRKHNK